MAQSDFGNLESPLSGEAFINGKLEPWRDAVHTQHSGNARPSYVQAGMIWLDVSGSPWLIKQFDGSNDIVLMAVNTGTGKAGLLGGTAESTPIGQTSPAAGQFTQLRYTVDVDFSSDKRLKRNIKAVGSVLAKVLQLKPVTFQRMPKGSRRQMGFLAQDVQQIFPDMISTDENGFLSLHGMDMFAMLVKATHELNQRLEKLEKKA